MSKVSTAFKFSNALAMKRKCDAMQCTRGQQAARTHTDLLLAAGFWLLLWLALVDGTRHTARNLADIFSDVPRKREEILSRTFETSLRMTVKSCARSNGIYYIIIIVWSIHYLSSMLVMIKQRREFLFLNINVTLASFF